MALLKACVRWRANRCPHSLLGLGSAIGVWLFLSGLNLPAQTTPPEYRLKAVFLFNFAEFVSWPSEAFIDPQAPLVIGVLGENPFGTHLDEVVRGERVNNRQLVVERYRRVEDIKVCHILFISRSEAGRLDEILPRLKNRSVLTVSDIDRFAARGGIIRFINEKNRIRL